MFFMLLNLIISLVATLVLFAQTADITRVLACNILLSTFF